MSLPARIRKLDETVVNRIAAGEIIQRPANALKELIENSLDAKATNIQILAKEGGMKLLQIQDNGTGIRKEDMEIVCERYTTSKLQKFEDLKTISTFGFRGEALASMSHVALLTITTKTADEKCAYKASYIDSKLKAPLKPCAGNQGTTIMIENLFYNVATRRKALTNPAEEFAKISEVVTKYAVHNPTVGFTLKKHGETAPQVRTPYNSTKMNNIRILYGNPVARELLEVEHTDDTYKFKLHALITNPNYANKRMTLLLFINNRLVDCSSIRKMLEDLYSIHLPRKTHPWCYISLEIEPRNIDVNIHPTKHEVKFLHEDTIVERVRFALDERLTDSSASRTFYLQARLPKASIPEEALQEVLPEYEKDGTEKKKIHPRELIRTDSADQKLDKFNFTIHGAMKHGRQSDITNCNKAVNNEQSKNAELRNESIASTTDVDNIRNNKTTDNNTLQDNNDINQMDVAVTEKNIESVSDERTPLQRTETRWSAIVDETSASTSSEKIIPKSNLAAPVECNRPISIPTRNPDLRDILDLAENEENMDDQTEKCIDEIAEKAREKVYQYFGNKGLIGSEKSSIKQEEDQHTENTEENKKNKHVEAAKEVPPSQADNTMESKLNTQEFKSYSVNTFRREVKLTSVLKLRKEVEDNCHEGLRRILSDLSFVGCIDTTSALVQSGVNLYICNTKKLAEELFYEIMLYDFANYGVIKFAESIPLYDLAMLGLETEEAGWTEEDGDKEELATSVKELLLEKADMMKEYFSIVIDKNGNLKSLPILLDKYFPYEAGLPLYILRLATEVEWSTEQPCFRNICRETAMFYSQSNPVHNTHDWKYVTEHVLYPAIKESLLPPKHFAHDSTILQIASLPDLYKVFERC